MAPAGFGILNFSGDSLAPPASKISHDICERQPFMKSRAGAPVRPSTASPLFAA